ncbi:ThiJ domain-containing protein [Schizosaccharomyces cryophilus OY26]|uniref:D-lactate dehydratase n=1 Tax=Schizosaccharomyces cryophilus (strain OY26 / ATCC MYA-4695 / CBS 11777 / NBRC 106824 / NRRL Y48691) TaxID=653667 RepID=S9W585_SCHCR|nr:ThiJ domain-containing protein [Schizosaccharomyces cryophilus OY26]EPY53085.1 ThiJ domain-containing protein [Schizosaccharomyces cryophilus OY26]
MTTKKVLLATTSYYGPFYLDGMKTGAYFSETLVPFKVFRKAGYDVQMVSESGQCRFDDHSLTETNLGELEKQVLDDKNEEFWTYLKNTKAAKDVDPNEYPLLFVAGGHGAMFDLPTAKGVQNLAAKVYDNKGILAAVCHGPVLLAHVKNSKCPVGKSVVYGKNVTAFTHAGEVMMGLSTSMRNHNIGFLNEILEQAEAKYINPPTPVSDFVQVDGRIVTGVNPQSAKSTAEAAINTLESKST